MQRATFLFLTLWLCGACPLWASLSVPRSGAWLCADGTRLLVMVSPAKYEQRNPTTFTLPDQRVLVLNQAFSQSGLYDAVTLAPIWQVDWYSLPSDVRSSDDGMDLIVINRFGIESDWALAFYHQGRLTKQYRCVELLSAFGHKVFLPYEDWDWHYAWYDAFETNGTAFSVSTASRRITFGDHEMELGLQEYYTFDLRNGAMISQKVVRQGRYYVILAILILVCLIPIYFLLRAIHGAATPRRAVI